MIAASLKIRLELKGPVMTKATALGGFGLDAVMAQSDGQYYLPGTLVKGRLREAWQELQAAAPAQADWPIDEWLGLVTGNRRSKTPSFAPSRSRIVFGDFRDPKPVQTQADTRYRIKMDEARGSVERGAFLVLEAPYASGESCIFESRAFLLARNPAEMDRMHLAVEAGLRWISSLGAEKSVGFGEVISVKIDRQSALPFVRDTTLPPGERYALRLRFTEPFAVANRRAGQNLFEGDEIIPGAALRGAIAELLKHGLADSFAALANHLDAVRFTHAFPAPHVTPRPHHYPLSLFMVASRMHDGALLQEPPPDLPGVPEFDLDWKDPSVGPVLMGWPEVNNELRVRTAIESETARARDQALFGIRLVVPGKLEWACELDLSRIVDTGTRAVVAQQLAGIFKVGLSGIGKTKAFAEPLDFGVARPPPLPAKIKGKWIVCLQTPALLLNPGGDAELRTAEQMQQAYRDVWSELSGNSLRLSGYFQRTTLAGGDYLHNRFRRRHQYKPYLLTCAGSVFVFDEVGAAAEAVLQKWLKQGLPLTSGARAFYCDHAPPVAPGDNDANLWNHCPYIAENGYGEIALNLPVHTDKAWGDNA